MPVSDYFAADYAAARSLFLASARAAGADLATFELPGRTDPRGRPLSIDVARAGAAQADRALLLISGTHGVEGFCGSGCQVGYFSDRLFEALPVNACVLAIHALNPFGFAWLRRVNEDGVDLNRNFIDFSGSLPESEAYESLHTALVPPAWRGIPREQADAALNAFIARHGLRAFQAALTAGQYTRPLGLFYGGMRPTWSADRLMETLRTLLPLSVRRVAVLDLHTGLGPTAYGEPAVITKDPAEVTRARRWYGPEVKDLNADESVSAQIVGSVADGVRLALPRAETTYLGLEFGTRPIFEVLTALRGDHCLHAAADGTEAERGSIQQAIRDAFYVDTPAWQAAVYGRAADFIYRASRGLSEAE
jgi:hypothetical protein